MDYLSVSSYRYDGWPVVEASGELDVATRGQLRLRLHEVIAAHSPANVVVDLSGVEFCDAAGLSVLVAARREARQRSGELRLVSRKKSFRRLLEGARLDGTMPLYDSLVQAVLDPWPAGVSPGGGVLGAVAHAVETVAFTCGHCWHEWTLDYEVQRSERGDGEGDRGSRAGERYFRNGAQVPSPYVPSGAPACPRCGRRRLGRLGAQLPKHAESAVPAL
ncbi:STAS domain-containing protein [Streptomyces sp. NPDC055103]